MIALSSGYWARGEVNNYLASAALGWGWWHSAAGVLLAASLCEIPDIGQAAMCSIFCISIHPLLSFTHVRSTRYVGVKRGAAEVGA